MPSDYDILVLGATGTTGKLVARYLEGHRLRSSYRLAFGARSPSKLDALYKELSIPDSVAKVQVDVLDEASIEKAVKQTRVVLNTVGPFWRWGTPVVAACARNGVHYVDCTAEGPWIVDIVPQFHALASQSGAIVLPACALVSVPSDLSVYIANQTLKSVSPGLDIDSSCSAYNVRMGLSGGSVASLVTLTDEVPTNKFLGSTKDYLVSPIVGQDKFTPKLYYKLPNVESAVYGVVWHLGLANRLMIQRTWGLHEVQGNKEKQTSENNKLRYGPAFKYEEFHIAKNPVTATLFSLVLVFVLGLVKALKPIRWLLRFGESMAGPDEETMRKGILEVTNITTSVPTPSQPPVRVRTFFRGKGEPGFLITSILLAETALTLALDEKKLPTLARKGGVLTTASACGQLLVNRLKDSGWFDIESRVLKEGEDGKY